MGRCWSRAMYEVEKNKTETRRIEHISVWYLGYSMLGRSCAGSRTVQAAPSLGFQVEKLGF